MPTLTVFAAAPGNQRVGMSSSTAGHEWFRIDEGEGSPPTSYGFAPVNEDTHSLSEVVSSVPGHIYETDTNVYVNPAYSRTAQITQQQYDILQAFGNDPTSAGFSLNYNALTDNYMSFVWAALAQIGIEYTPDVRVEGNELCLRSYQIVDGCQTSNVLFEARDSISSDATFMLKIVETDDAMIVDDMVNKSPNESSRRAIFCDSPLRERN